MYAVANFITENPTPSFGYKQPWLTGLGSFILIPTQQAMGLYHASDTNASYCTKLAYKVLSIFLNLFLLPITLLGMAIKGIGGILPKHQYRPEELTDRALDIWSMPSKESSHIYSLLDAFRKICEEQKLPFFLEGGTLLGAERHGGIIPWDNDSDVGMSIKYEQQLLQARQTFKNAGLFIEKRLEGGLYKVGFIGHGAYLDIFLYDWYTPEGESEPRFTYLSSNLRTTFPRSYFLKSDFQDLKDKDAIPKDWQPTTELLSFGPPHPTRQENMLLPRLSTIDRRTILQRQYSSTCLNMGVLTHSHVSCCGYVVSIPNFTKCCFEVTNFDPAPWTEIIPPPPES